MTDAPDFGQALAEYGRASFVHQEAEKAVTAACDAHIAAQERANAAGRAADEALVRLEAVLAAGG